MTAFVAAAGCMGTSGDKNGPSYELHSVVIDEIQHDTMPVPLAQLPPAPRLPPPDDGGPGKIPIPQGTSPLLARDPVAQRSLATPNMPTASRNFEGIGNGFAGPSGTFTVNAAPPDTNGAVGPNHYVQTTNTDFAIFDKSGTVLYGPVQINTLFTGFGGGCQTNNDGDPVVQYDQFADRWIISQFSVSTTPYLQCVAVSTTGDPTGTYNRYAFSFGNTDFNDYPKIGVWPDGYYFTFNIFANGGTFSGARVCAFDRDKMLSGATASAQCFSTNTQFGGLLPASVDGPTPPPTAAPNYVVNFGANSLNLWTLHVDWTTPGNSTLNGPTSIAVAPFAPICNGDTCISQQGTTQLLDTLGDRLMYRLAYRNFGDHESLVVNHTVDSGGGIAGVRWYELRSPGGTPTVFQQSTFAPDGNHRWMGSVAMDKNGDLALGYSASSGTLFPSIRYAGRLASDAPGTLGQGEATLMAGLGSQNGGLSRWGDYSSLTVDPSDDCTFWYTTEYLADSGSFNWHTRIGSFTFPSCTGTVGDDFSISAMPASATVNAGSAATYTVSTAVTTGNAQTVGLSASGLPSGATASFSPTSVTAGSSATLTVSTSAGTAPGTYTIAITGTGTTGSHVASVALVVNSPNGGNIVNGSFETGDLSGWSPSGVASVVTTAHGGSYAAMLGAYGATVGDSAITQSFTVPSGGGVLSFWYQVHCSDTVSYDWATATLTDNTTGTTTTLLPLTCSNSAAWVQVTSNLSGLGGHNVTLRLVSHDDGYAADPTYTLYDDVTIGPPPPPPSPITNGGFETGDFTGWTAAGTASITTTAHGGSYAAMVGGTSATNGDSSITQTFNVPAAGGTLSFYYQEHCDDKLISDWTTATLTDNTTGTTTTLLAKTCKNTGMWVQVTSSLSALAGHSATIRLVNHDDNYPGDSTYTLFDDVTIVAAPPPPPLLTNADFETGDLSGWTLAGTASIATTAHGGMYAALVGSTNATFGDSSIQQSFKVPATGGTLSFWYQAHCNDTVDYDWSTATLTDNTTGTTTTLLDKLCKNTGAWVQVTTSLNALAGHYVTLTLTSHDDGYSDDVTYTLFDDVTLQ